MGIGVYRHRIGLSNPGAAIPDGYGGYTEGWTPLDPPQVDASIQSASATDLERLTGGTVLTTATHLVRTRFHPQITTATRITFGARTFDVQSAQNVDERDVALLLICVELKAPQPPDDATRRRAVVVGDGI